MKTFETYNLNDVNEMRIAKAINVLYHSIIVCPSLKHLVKDIEKIEDLFNVYGLEKSQEIIDKLKQLEPEINKWDMNDGQYLLKDDNGFKNAPTSQLNRVLSLFGK